LVKRDEGHEKRLLSGNSGGDCRFDRQGCAWMRGAGFAFASRSG
jgi:hypothetical protein